MFYQDNYAQVLRGDAREILPTLPKHSVDMCMTSPPYWGLRLYHGEPSIWDGDANCQHEWGDKKTFNLQWRRPELSGSGDVQVRAERNEAITQGQFCRLCGAWHGQLGLEPDPDLFCKHLCDIFDLVRKVLKPTGTLWVNLSDSYAGGKGQSGARDDGSQESRFERGESLQHGYAQGSGGHGVTRPTDGKIGVPAKSLVGIPFRFALQMIQRGFILRNTIIWHKPNVMPESMKDRFTRDYEFIFMFSLQQHYYFEQQFEVNMSEFRPTRPQTSHGKEPTPSGNSNNLTYNKMSLLGRNKRTVWDITTKSSKEEHYASYPEELCITPIKAGCPEFICPKCGKPRVKMYKVSGSNYADRRAQGIGGPYNLKPELMREASRSGSLGSEAQFIGYSDCGCGAEFYPGTVLDPFMGTGTTLAVAKKLGRKSLGIDTSEKYCEISARRLAKIQGVQKEII